jgi:hypothetical protein
MGGPTRPTNGILGEPSDGSTTPEVPTFRQQPTQLFQLAGWTGLRAGASLSPSGSLLCPEGGMVERRQWSDLSERNRRLITITAVAEGILKLAALIDLKRRPASQVRGPKWLWATVLAIVGSAGILPVSYFVFGRRPPQT